MYAQRSQYTENRKFIRFLKKIYSLNDGNIVLDAGCGVGTVSRILFKLYRDKIDIFGVEREKDLADFARQFWCNKPNMRVLTCDARQVPFPNENFDCITSMGFFEWIPDGNEIMQEMIRVLKPSGKMVSILILPGTYFKHPQHHFTLVFYNKYLSGLSKMGHPLGWEWLYMNELFSNFGGTTKRKEFIIESKFTITEHSIPILKEMAKFQLSNDSIQKWKAFYRQFVVAAGWKNYDFDQFIEKYTKALEETALFEAHIGEEFIQSQTILVLETNF